MQSSIRNFAIISHIDHGKSTLADRLMELAGLLPPLSVDKRRVPRIDRMELEIERGVTIKLKAVRMAYSHPANSRQQTADSSKPLTVSRTPIQNFILNMIDTPGHVDFSYEVSRSLAACEGALLLVDATRGPQAQTVAHLEKARSLGLTFRAQRESKESRPSRSEIEFRQKVENPRRKSGDARSKGSAKGRGRHHIRAEQEKEAAPSLSRGGFTIIGVINKIDSPLARVEETEKEMRALGIEGEILRISALKGWRIETVLEAVVGRIPSPEGEPRDPFRALIFDSTYDEYLGVVAYARVVDGKLAISDQRAVIRFLGTSVEAKVKEVGHFVPGRKLASELSTGEVGYIATGLKDPRAVRVGDTVALVPQLSNYQVIQLPGYKEPRSFVFASFFPATTDYTELEEALSKLRLEEPAILVEEISSSALGRGFKLGFLGTFHLEIVKERLEREFNLELVVTKPTVVFKGMEGPPADRREPWIGITAITPPEYLAGVTKLVTESRGKVREVASFGVKMKLSAELPLMEFIKDFYDRLKSLSSGYASLDWEFIGYRSADLVRLDIAVHGEVVEGLSEVVLKDQVQKIGRERVKRLKEVMPRQQFAYALQAKVGGKILAREDVPALRKDVTAPLYGGDVTRKRKLLEKQKKGKKKLAKFGKVEVPPEAFLV